MGFQITELDIAHADKPTQEQALAQADIVYIAGGNTFYLLQQLRDSGFGRLLIDFVNAGGLYAGVSAGALVAGTDIRPVETMDEPDKAPGLASTEALGFVSIVPIPHSNDKRVNALTSKYGKNYQLVYMTDDQAIVVEGDSWQIVESPMSQLEREWLENVVNSTPVIVQKSDYNRVYMVIKTPKEKWLQGLGLGLYWGEGNKKCIHSVRLGNTDPQLLRHFKQFLVELYGVDPSSLKYGLQIFTDIDAVDAIISFCQ
jgi:dipeptidase E